MPAAAGIATGSSRPEVAGPEVAGRKGAGRELAGGEVTACAVIDGWALLWWRLPQAPRCHARKGPAQRAGSASKGSAGDRETPPSNVGEVDRKSTRLNSSH